MNLRIIHHLLCGQPPFMWTSFLARSCPHKGLSGVTAVRALSFKIKVDWFRFWLDSSPNGLDWFPNGLDWFLNGT